MESNEGNQKAPRLSAAKKSEIAEAVAKRLLTDRKFLEDTADKLHASPSFKRRIIIVIIFVGLFAAAGYIAFGWFVLRTAISKTNEYATNQFAAYVRTNNLELSNQFLIARKELTNQITKEFETERIKAVVTDVAARRASEVLTEQIRPEILTFRLTVSNELVTTHDAIGTLKTNAAFIELVSAAEAGDRRAWDQLDRLADDLSYPFHDRARGAWRSVLSRYGTATESPFFGRYPNALEKAGLMATNVTLAELRPLFSSLPVVRRLETLQFVSEQSRFRKQERLLFFRDVRKLDNDLDVCAWAGRHFKALAPMPDINPLHDFAMDDWLKENLEKLKD